jgi:Ca2+-binding RTX toxin-like protein
LQGGLFVQGQSLPGGTWQIQPDGSIPGVQPINESNDVMTSGQDAYGASGTFQHVTGLDEGNITTANMRAMSFWGLGGHDFISGEHYDDYLDGGEGDDLIFGGAGSDTIHGGEGDDIIVTYMAAHYEIDGAEEPLLPGEVNGPDIRIDGATAANATGLRWWVVRSEDGSSLRVQRAAVKNPDGGTTYWPASESDLDTVDAGGGDDYVWGGRGKDYLLGGDGSDRIAGLGNHDVILGGSGKDFITGDDWASTRIMLTQYTDHERDVVITTNKPIDEALKLPELHGDDVIDAGADDDEVWGDGGSDVIFGGSGKDFLVGDALVDNLPAQYHGNDKLDGGDGDDTLFGFGEDDLLQGGEGDDELQGDSAQLEGGLHGKDFLDGGSGNDKLFGGGLADTLVGCDGDDQLDGDGEAAALNGSFHGDDLLDGGDGNDAIWGQGGSDVIYGGAGNDLIQADRDGGGLATNFHGQDFVDGGEGDDQISGGDGNDTLLGGDGNDILAGEDEIDANSISALTGDDQIVGGAGNDTLFGGNGKDELSGGEGDDALFGGAGEDVLEGGGGQNVLRGGSGNDTYRAGGSGVQIIVDTEGRNVVEGIDGLAAGASTEGDLVLSSGGRTVVLSKALLGGFAGGLSLDGQVMSLASYVGNAVVESVSLVGHGEAQTMLGGRGEDEIFANGLGSRIHAGKGSDQITLNSTGASILVSRGDGTDRVVVSTPLPQGAHLTDKVNLEFGEGITASDISFEYDGMNNVLKIRYSPEPDDVVEITYGGLVSSSVVDNPPVGEIRLADGSLVNIDFTPRVADEDAPFKYVIPAEVFGSLGTEISLSAKLADGNALPSWLHFDATTRTFSGTPENADTGSLNLQVMAKSGQEPESNFTFTLVVKNVNDAPEAGVALPGQEFIEPGPWSYDLPAGTFADVDAGDKLTYTAQLSDGKPLPEWLKIDAATGRLSSTTGKATHLNLSITATDQAGACVSQALEIYIKSSIETANVNGVVGTPGNDTLVGTSGSDVVVGGIGDDTLDGRAGSDELIGGNLQGGDGRPIGTGTDVYLFGRGDGTDIISNGWTGDGDVLKFKSGVKPEDIIVSQVNYDVPVWDAGIGARKLPSGLVLRIEGTNDSITIPDFHTSVGLGNGRVDSIQFTDHTGVTWDADTVSRLALLGSSGADKVHGYATDDLLRGNGGSDTLHGYRGNDAFQFGKDDGKDTLYEFTNEGIDKIVFDQGILPADVALIKSPEMQNAYPEGILVLRVMTGSTEVLVPNFFEADAGIESVEFADGTVWNRDYILSNLHGGGGNVDNFVGTPGNDEYVVDSPKDTIVEAADGGIDLVRSSVTYVLPDNVEHLTLTGLTSADATGNKLDNLIIGNNSNNTLDWGGAGLDTLQGGAGDDTYRVFAPMTTYHYFNNSYEESDLKVKLVESSNGGLDTLLTNAMYVKLPDSVENLKLSTFMASYFRGSLPPLAKYIGNSGDNTIDLGDVYFGIVPTELDGGDGNDTLIGTRGDNDTVNYSWSTGGIKLSLLLSGPQDLGAAGKDMLRGIEHVIGTQFNDELIGDWRNNRFDGCAGPDVMTGGEGNDTYFVDDLEDTVIELDGLFGGLDHITVNTPGIKNYVLVDNVENLTISLDAVGSDVVTGNSGGNVIKVDRRATDTVVLRGLGGDDSLYADNSAGMTLDGGDGNDTLVGSNADTVFIGGVGDDTYDIKKGRQDVIRRNAVVAPQEHNKLYLQGVSKAGTRFMRETEDLIIRGTATNSVRVEGFFGENGAQGQFNPLQEIIFDDYTSLDFAGIFALAKTNTAPVLQTPLEPVESRPGRFFEWYMPSSTFADDGPLTYSATLEDGSPLPSWATVDSYGSLTGEIPANISQELRIKFTATDQEGLSASDILTLTIRIPGVNLQGTSGDDTLRGGAGDDVLSGVDGKDQLQGNGGNDRLEGGAGNDALVGGAGMDTLIGGLGNDMLNGGSGDDVFEYTQGDGQDTLEATDAKTAVDKLLIHGWTPSQINLVRSGNNLQVRMGGTADQITLSNYFAADSTPSGVPTNSKIDQIVFDSGEIWDQAKIDTVLATPTPPPSSYVYAYVMPAANTNYTLSGNAPYIFKGNSKANNLTGNDGANVINGAAGNDTLTGGKGGDTYFLEAGTGQDTIVENDSAVGVYDLLQWGSNIRHDQIWLRKSGNNLEVSVIGTSDKAIVKDWYLGTAQHVEQIWANGKVLTDTKVQLLVDAMAAFSPPPVGQTTLNATYQAALNPVIATNWT